MKEPNKGTIREVERLRLALEGLEAERDTVAVEAPLTIDIKDVGVFTIMASPENARALALGFAMAEGYITSLEDVALLNECLDDPNVIRMSINNYQADGPVRNMAVMSSCGLCGSQSVDTLIAALPRVGDSLRIKQELIGWAARKMGQRQAIFSRTGGAHAAMIYTAQGEIISMAEDIGRHNALDKAIGLALLSGRSAKGQAAALSGRVSLEMAVKAARAGLELVSAVSAPTSLAIEAAEAVGLTLVNFVRGDGGAVYTNGHRLG